MYSEQMLNHFHRPRSVGEIPGATLVVEATNPVCGDLMKLWVLVGGGKIAGVKFKVAGCVPAVACGSWLTTFLIGKSLTELDGVSANVVEEALGGLPPASRHAAILAADALKQLLDRRR